MRRLAPLPVRDGLGPARVRMCTCIGSCAKRFRCRSRDPLNPRVVEVEPDDFSQPLQLLAHSPEYPLNGRPREFITERTL